MPTNMAATATAEANVVLGRSSGMVRSNPRADCIPNGVRPCPCRCRPPRIAGLMPACVASAPDPTDQPRPREPPDRPRPRRPPGGRKRNAEHSLLGGAAATGRQVVRRVTAPVSQESIGLNRCPAARLWVLHCGEAGLACVSRGRAWRSPAEDGRRARLRRASRGRGEKSETHVDRPWGTRSCGERLASVGRPVTTNPEWPETPARRRDRQRGACYRRDTRDTAATSDLSPPRSGPVSRLWPARRALPRAAGARAASGGTRRASAGDCDWPGSRSSGCGGSLAGARAAECAG